MKNILASLIVLAVIIMESKPKPKLIYSNVSYKEDRYYDRHHEDWNDYPRDTGL
jgi:uncharacterized protein YxeA